MTRLGPMHEPEIRLDRNKFLDVVHCIIDLKSNDPDALGRTKLHKALYFADMIRFFETGSPLTGVEYLKQTYGPTALQDSGAIQVGQRSYFGWLKVDFSSLRAPASNRLAQEDVDLLSVVADFVCGHSAKDSREISHALPWESVPKGARIPYITAFLLMPQDRPSAADLEWAQKAASELLASGQDERA